MALARMLNVDEDALVCDFAEVYGIYDWRALPLATVATLAFGLSEDSRIKRKLAGARLGLRDGLLCIIADRLGTLVWSNTKDAQKGRNRPKSILEALSAQKKESENMTFTSGAAFEEARARIFKEVTEDG